MKRRSTRKIAKQIIDKHLDAMQQRKLERIREFFQHMGFTLHDDGMLYKVSDEYEGTDLRWIVTKKGVALQRKRWITRVFRPLKDVTLGDNGLRLKGVHFK